MSHDYVALLRSINVGGRNTVAMTDLVALVEAQGHTNVSTLLQSGNVIFTARDTSPAQLELSLGAALEERFGFEIPALVRSHEELAATVHGAPPGHGSPELRSDVFFLARSLDVATVLAELPALREGVDAVAPGPGAFYFSRVAAQAGRTRITRLLALPVFQSMTVRSWGTTTRLLARLDQRRPA